MALLVVGRPIGIVVQSVSTVMRTYVGLRARGITKDDAQLPIRYFYFLAAGTVAVLGVVALVMPILFPIVFGSNWATSGDLVVLLLPNVAAVMVLRPMLATLSAANVLKPVLRIQFIMLITSLLPLYIGPQLLGFNLQSTVLMTSLMKLICGIICGVIALVEIRRLLAATPAI